MNYTRIKYTDDRLVIPRVSTIAKNFLRKRLLPTPTSDESLTREYRRYLKQGNSPEMAKYLLYRKYKNTILFRDIEAKYLKRNALNHLINGNAYGKSNIIGDIRRAIYYRDSNEYNDRIRLETKNLKHKIDNIDRY